jgi:hypothetical protein
MRAPLGIQDLGPPLATIAKLAPRAKRHALQSITNDCRPISGSVVQVLIAPPITQRPRRFSGMCAICPRVGGFWSSHS